ENSVRRVAFDPRGERVFTASDDGTARVWRLDGAGVPVVLRGHDAALHSLDVSADGRRVVTAAHDGTARVWNSDGTGVPIVLDNRGVVFEEATFSADGERV